MSIYSGNQRAFAETLSQLMYGNPFLPDRIEAERKLLGAAYEPRGEVWSIRPDEDGENPNARRIGDRAVAIVDEVRSRVAAASRVSPRELALYEDLVVYTLYHTFRDELHVLAKAAETTSSSPVRFWDAFRNRLETLANLPAGPVRLLDDPEHLVACFYQVRRAFLHIFEHIVGTSMPTARLRAGVWESIFTHDMRRYRRALFSHLGDITTLVVGPSGTGKELVARAIALARYVPFDSTQRVFADSQHRSFFALNLSALSPTLIESELFGHQRGSFTGAVSDRKGWFETCPDMGTVFLDEIGELDPAIQVKLLRVLQTRVFQRLGDTRSHRFAGKLIVATNRNLSVEVAEGRMRNDFYYRICSDVLVTPSLAEQLSEAPEDLERLVQHIVSRLAPEEAAGITREVVDWIDSHLARSYAWPGNIRELEQCVRSLIVHRDYRPLEPGPAPVQVAGFAHELNTAALTAEELLNRYCQLVYERTGSYEATGKRLQLDRRTVRRRVQTA